MSRPVRKTRLQKEIDHKSRSITSKVDIRKRKLIAEVNSANDKKSTNSGDAESIPEKNETQKHDSGKLGGRNRLQNEIIAKGNNSDDKNVSGDDLRKKVSTHNTKPEILKAVELPQTKKRSARLEAKRSTNNEASISEDNKTQKRDSGESGTGNYRQKKNEPRENNSNDTKVESADSGRNKLKDNLTITRNKFFISKKPGSHNDASTLSKTQRTGLRKKKAKTAGKQTNGKESLGYTTALRQTTLSESFGPSSLRTRLRPRKNEKEYKDSSNLSILLEKDITPDKRRSVVLLEKIDAPKANKEPIYRTIKSRDERTDDKDSVYDFQFDLNDPRERPRNRKKRRRKVTRKPIVAKNKKKNDLRQTNNNNDENENNNKAPEISEIITDKVPESLEAEKEPTNENEVEIQHDEMKNPRVRISNVETLTGDRKVSFKPNPSTSGPSSAKFNPFRSTQSIFQPRSTLNVKEMMDHSLLNKSLSPIKNNIDHFDAASPWRPPLPASFSSVQRVVQSTPQIRRNFGRTTFGLGIEEGDENAENVEARVMSPAKPSVVKTLNPLGVRISNAENIRASATKENGPLSPLPETNPSISMLGMARKPLGLTSNYGENKENSGFGDRLYRSPKKSDKVISISGSPGSKKRSTALYSRGESLGESIGQKKNSGVQEDENSPPVEEQKLLKQSNLNKFLNIDGTMPESYGINTSHGLFEESISTSVVKNKGSMIQTQPSINNCFGFDDDSYSDQAQKSPVKFDRKQATPVKNSFDRLKRRDLPTKKHATARISLGEIKNVILPRKEKNFEKLQSVEERNMKREVRVEPSKDIENLKKPVKPKNILDPVQFSDTFDVLSESELVEGNDKSTCNEIELFADLEPVHFTQPPRWSYAKKRERKQYWSSDEDEDDNEVAHDRKKPVLKKRKLLKLNKVEAKKINEWVKSVNETFQEIDNFDLVVEKLP